MAQIREMRASDWPQVERIYRQGIEAGTATFTTACPDYAAFDVAHTADARLVALESGAVVGWAALSPVSQRYPYRGVAELSIYIDQAMRGRGVGKALLGALIEASERAGYWTLQAVIIGVNQASIGLHEACGFRRVGTRERIAQDRFGRWQDTLLMERRSEKI